MLPGGEREPRAATACASAACGPANRSAGTLAPERSETVSGGGARRGSAGPAAGQARVLQAGRQGRRHARERVSGRLRAHAPLWAAGTKATTGLVTESANMAARPAGAHRSGRTAASTTKTHRRRGAA